MVDRDDLDGMAVGAALVLLSGVIGRMGWRLVREGAENIAIRRAFGELGTGMPRLYRVVAPPAPRRALPTGEQP